MTNDDVLIDDASVDGDATGRPIGHDGTRVLVEDRPAWTASRGPTRLLAVVLSGLRLLLAVVLFGLGIWWVMAPDLHKWA